MAFPDLAPLLKSMMPELRGRALPNQPLAELTWFRAGGPAQLLFMPEDEADLGYFLAHLPDEFAVTVIGPGLVPVAGVTESQFPPDMVFAEAENCVGAPLLVTLMVPVRAAVAPTVVGK